MDHWKVISCLLPSNPSINRWKWISPVDIANQYKLTVYSLLNFIFSISTSCCGIYFIKKRTSTRKFINAKCSSTLINSPSSSICIDYITHVSKKYMPHINDSANYNIARICLLTRLNNFIRCFICANAASLRVRKNRNNHKTKHEISNRPYRVNSSKWPRYTP